MSIDWSRIYPTGMEEEPNRQGLEFYWNIFRELKKYNIEPLVTIWHGETPLYIENELLGWANRKTIELFKNMPGRCLKSTRVSYTTGLPSMKSIMP